LDNCGEKPRKSYMDYDFYIATWNVLSAWSRNVKILLKKIELLFQKLMR
jgi:hypothetical protein